MTPVEVSKLVTLLMACYPGVRFPDGTVVAYETFLVELDHDRAKAAVRDLVRTSKFMPTIAEIVTAYEAQTERGSEVPYHRQFAPRRDHGRVMPPREFKAAIDEYLAKAEPPKDGAS